MDQPETVVEGIHLVLDSLYNDLRRFPFIGGLPGNTDHLAAADWICPGSAKPLCYLAAIFTWINTNNTPNTPLMQQPAEEQPG